MMKGELDRIICDRIIWGGDGQECPSYGKGRGNG